MKSWGIDRDGFYLVEQLRRGSYTTAMTRGILIAGAGSSLSQAIAAEAARRVEHFASAVIPGDFSVLREDGLPERKEGAAAVTLAWNPGSPISARSLVIAAENRLGHIDEAILVCTPPSIRKKAHELSPGGIETIVNDHIKGWFFLVRELCAVFKERKAGTLALVLSGIRDVGEKDGTVDMMGPPVAASFRALAQGVLASSLAEPYEAMAFSSDTAEDALFAAFIFKILEEDYRRSSGKWHKYCKLAIFGR